MIFGNVKFKHDGVDCVAVLKGDPPRWFVVGKNVPEDVDDLLGELNEQFDPLKGDTGPQYGQFAAKTVHDVATFLQGDAWIPDQSSSDDESKVF